MLGLFKNFAKVKVDQTANDMITALVRFDPKGATEAELRVMDENLTKLTRDVAQARVAYAKEQKEADAIQQLHAQRLTAAEMLDGKLASAATPEERAQLEKSLGTLVKMLEDMQPEIEREIQEAAEAKEFLDMLEDAARQAAEKMKTARGDLERAQREMAIAEQRRETAERQAAIASQAAGIRNATSGLSVALKAMQDQAARDNQAAEASRMKAAMIAPTKPEQDDPNIAAALALASGKTQAPVSLSDRLAALKSPKQG